MDIAHMSDEQVTAALRELLRAEQELARPVAATPSPAAPPPATPTPATPMAPSYVTPAAAAMQSTPPSTAQHIPTAMPDVPSPVAQDAPAAVPPVAMQYMPSVMPATWGTEGAWGQQAQPPSWITTAQGTQQRILKAQQDYQRSLARAWLPDQVWQRLEDALRAYKRAVSEALGQPDTQAITPSTIAMLAQVMMNTAAAIDPGKDADGRPAATPER